MSEEPNRCQCDAPRCEREGCQDKPTPRAGERTDDDMLANAQIWFGSSDPKINELAGDVLRLLARGCQDKPTPGLAEDGAPL